MRREPFVIECYFWKDGDAWVGHSMSFDLRVDALNLEKARLRLGENITIYVDEALASEPSEQARLLKVKAPLSLQLSLKGRFWFWRLTREVTELWARESFPAPREVKLSV